MERYPHKSDDQEEMTESRRLGHFSTRWRALALTVGFVFVLLFVLFARLLPVYSDDGPGEPKATPDSAGIIWKYPSGDKSLLKSAKSTAGDLLINGDMDQQGFYWRYPNHYIPGSWFEWFSTELRIPEFDDGHRLGFAHTHPSSQRIHSWATTYAGGLMQSVTVIPCTYYQFQAYGHSRPGSSDPPLMPVASHMRVGIEPYGWMSGRTIPKYDPGLEPEDIPSTVVWSPEATHNFVWSPYQVKAEALASTITAVLYSYPEVNPDGGVWWNDTMWDTASLIKVPPPSGTILEGGILPTPDGLITNLSITALPNMAIVKWDTPVDASTQILYQIFDSSKRITLRESLNYSVIDLSDSWQHSPVDQTPVRRHLVGLGGLPDDYTLDIAALSRWFDGGDCVTSASDVTRVESAGESYSTHMPLVANNSAISDAYHE